MFLRQMISVPHVALETIRGLHKVAKERVQRIAADVPRHHGIGKQMVVKQVTHFSDCQLP